MDNTATSFNTLPSEVCEAILKQLSQNSALNLRLVNKRCKTLINELYPNWSIKVDPKCPDLESMFKLKIKKIEISHLEQPLPFLPVQGNSRILKYPDILESLRMLCGHSPTAHQYQYLNPLLHQSKNLRNLYLSLDSLDRVEVPQNEPISYDLAKLSDLKIRLYGLYESIPLTCSENNVFVQLMHRSDLTNLRSLDININIYNGKDALRMWKSIFVFLQRAESDCKNLKSLTVGGSLFDEMTHCVFGNCLLSTLENLVITFLGKVVPDFWKSFIKGQKTLKNLKVEFLSFPSDLLSNLVGKNFETLTAIKMKTLTAEERMLVDGANSAYFNLEIFQNCRNLKKLKLWFLGGGVFCNFNKLPRTLHALNLLGGMLDSDEILNYFTGQNEVIKLKIDQAGSWGRFGFNGTILEVLLGLEALTFVSVGEWSINSSVEEEKVKLEMKFNEFYTSTSTDVMGYKRFTINRGGSID